MRSKGEAISNVLHVLGVGVVGGSLILAVPGVLVLVDAPNYYLGWFPLVLLPGMFLPGVALLVSAKVLQKRLSRAESPSPLLPEGLARCASCGEPLRAQSGYYQETPSKSSCPKGHLRTRLEVLDQQVSDLFQRWVLPRSWPLQVVETFGSLQGVPATVREELKTEKKADRLRQMYANLEIGEEDYQFEKRRLDLALSSSGVPGSRLLETQETVTAGETLHNLLAAWRTASQEERARILGSVLDGVYCDLESEKVVALEPKDAFRPFLTPEGA